ncbi:hypothetical protein V6N11_031518 [Hibiscus sabdariffa]|uniref:Uncharacterized protein n=1 Tax=Hibiscus sabdariffa TaxID=183260 RepID=A0ABR2SYN1_9ROSI
MAFMQRKKGSSNLNQSGCLKKTTNQSFIVPGPCQELLCLKLRKTKFKLQAWCKEKFGKHERQLTSYAKEFLTCNQEKKLKSSKESLLSSGRRKNAIGSKDLVSTGLKRGSHYYYTKLKKK